MGWFWSKRVDIKDVKEVPKRRKTDTIEFRMLELNVEIEQLKERILYGDKGQ